MGFFFGLWCTMVWNCEMRSVEDGLVRIPTTVSPLPLLYERLSVRIYQPQKQSLRWIKGVQFAWDCCRIHFMSILHRFRGSRSIMWILLSSQHYVSAHKLRIKTIHDKYDNCYQVVNSFVWNFFAEGVYLSKSLLYIASTN